MQGFGPLSMPDLIIAEVSYILRFNRHPYILQLEDANVIYMGSSNGHNMDILAQMIASKVTRHYSVDYSEEDLEEPISKFLSA